MTDRSVFILIPGAGGSAWYWHLVAPRIEQRGHEAVAVGLPAADDTAGLHEYAAAVVQAIDSREPRRVVLVAQSLVARERLGIWADDMPGGHLVALSQPEELAARLATYATEAGVA